MKIPNDATSSNGVAGKDTNGVTEDDSAPRCIVIEEKLKAKESENLQGLSKKNMELLFL